MKYSMQCTCGHTITVDAESKEDAISQIKGVMTPNEIAKHMDQKHKGQAIPSNDQVYAMITQTTQAMAA